jgi:hypothetical protein
MMPLCTTAILPSQETCGCAFVSLGRPCVAQRVWPIPRVDGGSRPAMLVRRSRILPALFATAIRSPSLTATPAES